MLSSGLGLARIKSFAIDQIFCFAPSINPLRSDPPGAPHTRRHGRDKPPAQCSARALVWRESNHSRSTRSFVSRLRSTHSDRIHPAHHILVATVAISHQPNAQLGPWFGANQIIRDRPDLLFRAFDQPTQIGSTRRTTYSSPRSR